MGDIVNTPITNGGWTRLPEDQARWDGCTGGHPGGWYADEHGDQRCPRCGRLVDLTACGCGTPGHEKLSRSYCPVRMRDDQRAVHRDPEIVERDRAVAARIRELMTEQGIDAEQLVGRLGFLSPARLNDTLIGERALVAAEVTLIADALGVRTSSLLIGCTDGPLSLPVSACTMPVDQE